MPRYRRTCAIAVVAAVACALLVSPAVLPSTGAANDGARDYHRVPALATSWSTSADKLVWTFAIRDGMTWSDGRPVTANDIVWTVRLMMTNPAAATANGNVVANFDSVVAPDPRTLVIRLKRPQATMLALDIPIVPQHVWESKVTGLGTFWIQTCGARPTTVGGTVSGDNLVCDPAYDAL